MEGLRFILFVGSYPDILKHTEYHDNRLDGGVHTVPDFQTTPKNQADWNLNQDFQRLLLGLKHRLAFFSNAD